MCKVIKQWRPVKNELCILYLDEETPSKSYWNYRIDDKIYKPIPMSFYRNNSSAKMCENCIAIEGEGIFVGKEVEFVD